MSLLGEPLVEHDWRAIEAAVRAYVADKPKWLHREMIPAFIDGWTGAPLVEYSRPDNPWDEANRRETQRSAYDAGRAAAA